MSFNASNTKVIFFSYKNNIDLPKITLQNIVILNLLILINILDSIFPVMPDELII